MSEWAEKLEIYQGNVFPAMVAELGKNLGLSPGSLLRLGIGWKPNDGAWIIPERDAEGEITGLTRRWPGGKKRCEKKSKRGLIYPYTPVIDGYDPARQRWERVTTKNPCPICGKTKWCGLDGNVFPPRFVRCMSQRNGAIHCDKHGGFIHELEKGSFKPVAAYQIPLPESHHPIIVVEGATDVAAALDLDFIAVGRPQDLGCSVFLRSLLAGRNVIIVGENDAGAGRRGMEAAFEALKTECPSVVKLMPPTGIKDLRAWLRAGLTQQGLLQSAVETGSSKSKDGTLQDDAPLVLARHWLATNHMSDKVLLLRKYRGVWYRHDGHAYNECDETAEIRGDLYRFLDELTIAKDTKSGLNLESYKPTRHKIGDVMDALNADCPVSDDPPCWLDGHRGIDPRDLIVFANGLLDVEAYLHHHHPALQPLSPRLFHLGATPFPFDSHAQCPKWLEFINEIFCGDEACINLLQEWFGYNMVADTRYQKMLLMVGRPGSGKGTTLSVLSALLGKGQCARSSFRDLTSPFGLQPLIGKRAIILPDAHVPRRVDAMHALEILKSVVGNDPLTVNRKFLPQIPDIKLPGRITIAVNELPELPDHARSLERRLALLYFGRSFEGQEDWTLADRLCEEAPGVAVWALEGLRRLRYQDKFTVPDSSEPVMNEFRSQLSPIAEFLDECCEFGGDLWVPAQQLFDTWMVWAHERGIRSGSRAKFGERVLHQRPELKRERQYVGRQRVRVYIGLGLTGPAKEKYLVGGPR